VELTATALLLLGDEHEADGDHAKRQGDHRNGRGGGGTRAWGTSSGGSRCGAVTVERANTAKRGTVKRGAARNDARAVARPVTRGISDSATTQPDGSALSPAQLVVVTTSHAWTRRFGASRRIGLAGSDARGISDPRHRRR